MRGWSDKEGGGGREEGLVKGGWETNREEGGETQWEGVGEEKERRGWWEERGEKRDEERERIGGGGGGEREEEGMRHTQMRMADTGGWGWGDREGKREERETRVGARCRT